MIEYICGTVVGSSGTSVIVEMGGVGLRVHAPSPVASRLQKGSRVKLFAALYLKNEEIKLYGFETEEERSMFEKLQTVSGVGPAIALAILSKPLPTLYRAIVREELSVFQGIKGVGQKTAQRIVLELKGSLAKQAIPSALPSGANASVHSDAIAALLALGYAPEDAAHAVEKAWEKAGDSPTLNVLIREALAQKG